MRIIKDHSLNLKGVDKYVDLVIEKQIKNRPLWDEFVKVFGTGVDDSNVRWSGEFFGKMMRGAALIYTYKKDDEVYDILTDTVIKLLARQDELGRISSHSVDMEFMGWDVWCRKYVMVGLLHYYDICKDEELKKRIVEAIRKHLDYIISKIGPDKLDICKTSDFWEGLNSCSILEPIMAYYNIIKEPKYLEFAKYIVERGGTDSQNLIELAYANEIKPYQYKVTKAYEMMSFFEGVFEYYKVTKEEKLFTAVKNFVDAVAETDLTLIGSCGCVHELFDNSTITQTIETDIIKQETCVTVTWIRLNTKLLMYTNDIKYFENIESSFYNGLLGALNTENEKQYAQWEKKYFYPSLFDSYSPLTNAHRGYGIGGFQYLSGDYYFGCCIAIGAAGIALMPLTAVMEKDGSLVINNYVEGDIDNGNLSISSGYLTDGVVFIKANKAGHYSLMLRKPAWAKSGIIVKGQDVEKMGEGYNIVQEYLEEGEEIKVCLAKEFKPVYINDSVAFLYPPLVLAFDQYKQKEFSPRDIKFNDRSLVEKGDPENDEIVRFYIDDYIFTNYDSCGKHYWDEKNLMSIWFKTE